MIRRNVGRKLACAETPGDPALVGEGKPSPYLKRNIPETMLMSEEALAEFWDTPEEDEAWAYL